MICMAWYTNRIVKIVKLFYMSLKAFVGAQKNMKVIYTRFTNIYFFYILNQKLETDQSMLNDIVLPKPRDFKNPIRCGQK